MIAVENIELYRYEIHSLLKAFYPQETVKVFVGEPDVRKYPGPAFLRVEFEQDRIGMTVFPEGAPAHEMVPPEGAAEMPFTRTVRAPEGTAFDQKSTACKTAAKHLLYEMLCDYTKTSLPWGELIGIRPTKIAMARLREGDSVEEAARYMETEHLVSPEKAALAAQIAERERKILSGIHYENGFSLYVGIPFCPTTCLYCSFTSYPLASWKPRVGEYLDALEREMAACAPMFEGRILDTLYIGGGTPTTLEPAESERLISMISQYFDTGALQEFTVEAGRPDSITAEKLAVLRECGVSRISVNPQTMRDRTLKLIGRQHTAAQTEEAFRLARDSGFDNINMARSGRPDCAFTGRQEGLRSLKVDREERFFVDQQHGRVHGNSCAGSRRNGHVPLLPVQAEEYVRELRERRICQGRQGRDLQYPDHGRKAVHPRARRREHLKGSFPRRPHRAS